MFLIGKGYATCLLLAMSRRYDFDFKKFSLRCSVGRNCQKNTVFDLKTNDATKL